MKSTAHVIGTAAIVSALLLLSGCPADDKTKNVGCAQDSDCGSPAEAFRCETQNGVCYCRTNDACPASQFCNTAGFCQDKSGCEKNSDCIGADLFCDTSSGTCLTRGKCTTDLHCPLGQVCRSGLCTEGCRRDGDCPGVSCRCGDVPCGCTGTTAEELAACQIGVCDPAFCSSDSFCKYGEICGAAPDAGTTANQCYSDYNPDRRPYCDACSWGGGTAVCGSGPNFCLIDTAHPGNFYCGADCSSGQTCPRGYACQDVIVVGLPGTARCSVDNPSCPTHPNLPCTTNEDCPRGGVCGSDGHCGGRCAIDEGESFGFCTCLEDFDCGNETCSQGECSISRRTCVSSDDCRPLRCVDFNGVGGCHIGENCAPDEGLTCLEVQPGQ